LHVADIVKDLPPVFERFYGNVDARTCKRCGTVMPPK
jgi:3-hydroxyanthranilate 3,4-dioxygenase